MGLLKGEIVNRPAQFDYAVFISLVGQMIKGIPKKMNVAPLPQGFIQIRIQPKY